MFWSWFKSEERVKWSERMRGPRRTGGAPSLKKTKEEIERDLKGEGTKPGSRGSLETQRRDSLAGKSCQTARKLKVGRKLESGIWQPESH